MNTTSLKEKVHQFIADNTFSDVSLIQDDTLIFKEGYFDSMGFLTLISFLEDEFGVKTEDKDFVEENFESINAIARYVEQKTAVKA
ncbi:MAG: acyl carrier protein [Bacteroidales bacterium]